MDGRAFLEIAKELARGATEAHQRSAVGRAYYAVMLEARQILERWGESCPPRDNVHHFVRLKLMYSKAPDLKRVGSALERLGRLRNDADYELSDLKGRFIPAGPEIAQAIESALNAIAVLDEIDADDARRAAAIAALKTKPSAGQSRS